MNNEIERLEPYHRERWARGEARVVSVVKPQPRRPWAMAWFATFPNDDVVAFAEYPEGDFAAWRGDARLDVEAYQAVINRTEREIPLRVVARLIVLEHYPQADAGRPHPLVLGLARPCARCRAEYSAAAREKCPHRLRYRPQVVDDTAFALVAKALGSADARASLYVMRAACPNFCAAKRSFAYVDDDPEAGAGVGYQERDFNDLDAALYAAKLHVWRNAPAALEGPTTPLHRHKPRD